MVRSAFPWAAHNSLATHHILAVWRLAEQTTQNKKKKKDSSASCPGWEWIGVPGGLARGQNPAFRLPGTNLRQRSLVTGVSITAGGLLCIAGSPPFSRMEKKRRPRSRSLLSCARPQAPAIPGPGMSSFLIERKVTKGFTSGTPQKNKHQKKRKHRAWNWRASGTTGQCRS